MASQEQIDQYRDRGYLIADDVVEPAMLERLTTAARRVVAKILSAEVVGPLTPGQLDDGKEIGTGRKGEDAAHPRTRYVFPEISGLIAPEFGEPVFAEYLGSEPVARYLRPFLGDELRLGWLRLCAVRGDYVGSWHRDIAIARDASCAVEMEILARYRKNFMKWHMALVDDPCLWIVPGSQRRFRTEREREVLINNGQGEIPGAQQIVLKRGQTIFWNGNSIHRGLKPEGMAERLTLMGALIDHRTAYDEAEKGDERWLLAGNIRGRLPERTRQYYDNWRSLAEQRLVGHSGHVGQTI